jgi:hypothetical protein
MLDKEFQKSPWNGRRDTDEKVLLPAKNKVPFVNDQQQPNFMQ